MDFKQTEEGRELNCCVLAVMQPSPLLEITWRKVCLAWWWHSIWGLVKLV